MFSPLSRVLASFLSSRKKLARKPQRSKFNVVEDLEARQLLSASGSGDHSHFTPRITNALSPQPPDLNWATDSQAGGASLPAPTPGSTPPPPAANYLATGTVIKNQASN